MSLNFTLLKSNAGARLGELKTAHSTIKTPVFMPVGTKATLKAMYPEDVATMGAEIILANTYHIMITPGEDIVENQGGLHKFMNWQRSILTDSGGFQVMSLSSLSKIEDSGVKFKSHRDGISYFLTPQKSVQIQHKLDSNITMVMDECVKYPAEKTYVKNSLKRTHLWAKNSKDTFIDRIGYGIFGINQGGFFEDLRKESAQYLSSLKFDGYAVGGLAVGEPQVLMFEALNFTTPHLPINKPRYLMGVGRPSDILGAVERGIDMFDCVLPSRAARNARAFTHIGEINLRNARHKNDSRALDPHCLCKTCTNYSRAYLHHLFRVEEILSAMLLTTHNLHFYLTLMHKIREAITADNFLTFKQEFLNTLNSGDIKELNHPN